MGRGDGGGRGGGRGRGGGGRGRSGGGGGRDNRGSRGGGGQQQQQSEQQPSSQRNSDKPFNAREVSRDLNEKWKDSMDAATKPDRPEVQLYQAEGKAWGGAKPAAVDGGEFLGRLGAALDTAGLKGGA